VYLSKCSGKKIRTYREVVNATIKMEGEIDISAMGKKNKNNE